MGNLSVSRRQFLEGGALSAAGLAAAGLLASCASNQSAGTGNASTESAGNTAAESNAPELQTASETVESDILIVGCGGAGLMAAYAAGKAGAKNVLVIGNCPSITDNNGNMVSGTCAVETPELNELGQEFSIEDLFARMIDFAHWSVNALLLRNCVSIMPETIQIFKDMGVEFTLGADRYSIGFMDVHLFATPDKSQIFQKYLEDNFGTQFRFGVEAHHAIMDGEKFAGVQAEDEDGNIIDFKAKATCLACGGYIANPDMLAQVYGDMPIVASSTPYQTGYGIKIGQEAGGFWENSHGMGMNDIFGSTTELGFNLGEPLLGCAFYGGLIVNQIGKRFVNEYMLANASMAGGGEATLHAERYYAIFGNDIIEGLKTQGYYQLIGSPEFWVSGMLLYSTPIEDLDTKLQDAIDLGWVHKADTIQELADELGLPELVETVKTYDGYCADGYDPVFNKQKEMLVPVETGGPYYIFKYNPGAFNTFGGCRTDEYTRALHSDFTVIEGLYIAGVENGSLYSRPYYDVGGTCSGLAYASGRLAGQAMADYIK